MAHDPSSLSSEVSTFLANVDSACADVGRDPATLQRTIGVVVHLPGFAKTPSEPSEKAPPLTGTPEEIAAGLRAFAELGVSHLQVIIGPATTAGVEAFAPILAALDKG